MESDPERAIPVAEGLLQKGTSPRLNSMPGHIQNWPHPSRSGGFVTEMLAANASRYTYYFCQSFALHLKQRPNCQRRPQPARGILMDPVLLTSQAGFSTAGERSACRFPRGYRTVDRAGGRQPISSPIEFKTDINNSSRSPT